MEDYFAQPAPPERPRTPQPPPGARPGWAPPREEAVLPVATPARPGPATSTSGLLPLALLLSGLVLAVSAFLPWLKVFVVGVSGMELGDVELFPAGRVVLGLGVVVALAGVKELTGGASTGTRAGAAVAGLAAVVVALGTRSRIDDAVERALAYAGDPGLDMTGLLDAFLPHAGAGLWTAVVAGAAATASAVALLPRR